MTAKGTVGAPTCFISLLKASHIGFCRTTYFSFKEKVTDLGKKFPTQYKRVDQVSFIKVVIFRFSGYFAPQNVLYCLPELFLDLNTICARTQREM
jgi:hypothetical protein